ncbi:MAG TPA: hypothetical protein V6D47_22220 [Oscillatoriaceae cyanobacterium]
MYLLLGLAALAAAGVAFEGLYRTRDAATIALDAPHRTPWQELPRQHERRRFVCQVPFVNRNARYEQTLVNVNVSLQVLAKGSARPEELAGTAVVRALNADGRGDGYWAATLVGPSEKLEAELQIEVPAVPGVTLHAAVVHLTYQTYGRGALLTHSDEIVLPLSEVKPLPAMLEGETVGIQCVPTHLLTDRDDIVEVIDLYTREFRQPGDVVAVAESVVAITQHQYFRPADVEPGYFARRLCYFVPSKGSLSSPHGFQTAMNQVGAARMVVSMAIGALGKLVGQKGLFYTLAGRPAELIDDVTGTMPPFDKYIVAGPAEPERVVARIKERTGLEAAIVDANDLKRAMVLACTPGVAAAEVSRMLLDNPFGNAAEQTPVVVLRPRVTSADRSSQRDQSCSV